MDFLIILWILGSVVVLGWSCVSLIIRLEDGISYKSEYREAGLACLGVLFCWTWPVVVPLLLLGFGIHWTLKGIGSGE